MVFTSIERVLIVFSKIVKPLTKNKQTKQTYWLTFFFLNWFKVMPLKLITLSTYLDWFLLTSTSGIQEEKPDFSLLPSNICQMIILPIVLASVVLCSFIIYFTNTQGKASLIFFPKNIFFFSFPKISWLFLIVSLFRWTTESFFSHDPKKEYVIRILT